MKSRLVILIWQGPEPVPKTMSLKFKSAANFSSREEEELSLLGWSWKNLQRIWILAKKKNGTLLFSVRRSQYFISDTKCLIFNGASNMTPAQRSHITYGMLITLHPFFITGVWTASVAWNSSDCFESFSPLNNVWIDRPLMPSSDITHYPNTG